MKIATVAALATKAAASDNGEAFYVSNDRLTHDESQVRRDEKLKCSLNNTLGVLRRRRFPGGRMGSSCWQYTQQ